MSEITRNLKEHYAKKFQEFGATSEGVDWGPREKAALRYNAMLNVIPHSERKNLKGVSLLDIGSGYGGQLEFAIQNGLEDLDFTGIDVVKEMVDFGNEKFSQANFIEGDFLSMDINEQYDYVTCNGILTQKLSASYDEMKEYMDELVTKMFKVCRKGIAFNTMSTYVDYEMEGNFHNDPSELLRSMFKHTRFVRLDHAYPLYEYTIYLYK